MFEGIPDSNLGKFEFKVKSVDAYTGKMFLLFTIDVSDSMNDKVNKYVKKIDFVVRVLENIANYMCEHSELDIVVQINKFNDDCTVVLPATRITSETISSTREIISKIAADRMTNIELALKKSKEAFTEYTNNEYKQVHFFLTDGNSNRGECSITKLVKMVDTEIPHVFIGFGTDHNARFLKQCASVNSENIYMFIDSFEDTGKAYGEALHNFLYTVVKNVELEISGGTFYDGEKNIWTNKITIPAVFSEQTKNIYIRKNGNEPIEIQTSVSGKLNSVVSSTQHSIETNNIESMKHYYRLVSLKLLYDCIHIEQDEDGDEDGNRMKELKKEMKNLFTEMKKWIRSNGLEGDVFAKVTCDDLQIAYLTLGTENGYMFGLSRQTSAVRETSYRMTPTSLSSQRQNQMRMRNRVFRFHNPDFDENEDPEDNIETCQLNLTSDDLFTTPNTQSLMRDISRA